MCRYRREIVVAVGCRVSERRPASVEAARRRRADQTRRRPTVIAMALPIQYRARHADMQNRKNVK